jgi:hypothetical protein
MLSSILVIMFAGTLTGQIALAPSDCAKTFDLLISLSCKIAGISA